METRTEELIREATEDPAVCPSCRSCRSAFQCGECNSAHCSKCNVKRSYEVKTFGEFGHEVVFDSPNLEIKTVGWTCQSCRLDGKDQGMTYRSMEEVHGYASRAHAPTLRPMDRVRIVFNGEYESTRVELVTAKDDGITIADIPCESFSLVADGHGAKLVMVVSNTAIEVLVDGELRPGTIAALEEASAKFSAPRRAMTRERAIDDLKREVLNAQRNLHAALSELKRDYGIEEHVEWSLPGVKETSLAEAIAKREMQAIKERGQQRDLEVGDHVSFEHKARTPPSNDEVSHVLVVRLFGRVEDIVVQHERREYLVQTFAGTTGPAGKYVLRREQLRFEGTD